MRELPEGWAETIIDCISHVTKLAGFEFTNHFKYQDEGEVRVVRGLNIGFGKFKDDNFKYITSEISDKLPRSSLSGGEVLITYVGSLGSVAILPNNKNRYHLGPNVGKISVDQNIYSAKLLLLFLISSDAQRKIRNTGKAVAQSSLSMTQIRSLPLPLPPLNEQKRIADRLDQLLTRIDKTKAHLDRIPPLLKRFRQSVLAAATSGKLTEEWREENDLDLDNWQLSEIEPFLSKKRPGMKTGPFGSLLKKSDYCNSGIPIIGIENISELGFQDGCKVYISQSKAKDLDTYDLQPNDIIISRSGTVGEICIIPDNIGEARFSSNTMRLILDLDLINSEYFVFLFRGSSSVLQQISDLCKGSTRDFLNQKILKALMYPLPTLEEQQEIVRRVEALFTKADRIEAQYKNARQQVDRLTPALLAKAFRGELVPQDPKDEPASVLLERVKEARSATQPVKAKRKAVK